jgi:uncharacterized protein YkwD
MTSATATSIQGILIGILLAGLTTEAPAQAHDAHELVALVNAYRAAPQTCEGKRIGPLEPLTASPVLSRVRFGAGDPLQAALELAGYGAAHAQGIVLSGPRDPGAAMALAAGRYCGMLLNPAFSEVGVSRAGSTWRLVLARPVISPELPGWREAGKAILELVNAARAEPRRCGERTFAAAPPLKWNEQLASAALAHSRDMASLDYLDHVARDGSTPGDRAARAGYKWRRIAENVAAGQGSMKQVVSTWLTSPEHCENIMERALTEMGAAYSVNEKARKTIYWTQLFGSTR